MPNTIEGGSSGSTGFDLLDDAVDGLKDAADVAKKTVESVVDGGDDAGAGASAGASGNIDHAEDSWKADDGGDSFWDEVKGAASKAADDVEGLADKVVDDAATGAKAVADTAAKGATEVAAMDMKAVGDMLDGADRAIHEVGDVATDVIAGGEKLYGEMRHQQAKLADEIVGLANQYPPEDVADAAKQALEGTWQLGGELLQAGMDAAVDDVVRPAVHLPGQVRHGVESLAEGVVQAGARAVAGHSELIKQAAAMASKALDSDLVNTVIDLQLLTPQGLALKGAQTIGLELAHMASSSPDVAKKFVENPNLAHELVSFRDANAIARDVQKLPIGDSYQEQSAVELSAHADVGGLVAAGVTATATHTGKNTYEVAIDVNGKLGGGAGEETAGEGAKGDADADMGGHAVLRFTGPDAARDAARVVAMTHGDVGEVLALAKSDSDATLIEASGSLASGVEGEAFDHKLDIDVELTKGFTTIDGKRYVGGTVSAGMSFEAKTASVQVGDDLAAAWMKDKSFGNPALDALMSHMPPGVAKGIKQVYGPTVGLRLAAEPKATVGLYAPEGQTEPLRATFHAEVPLRAGRTELKGEIGFTITDVGKLARALGSSQVDLATKLAKGELTMSGLRQIAQKQNVALDRYVELEGPKITMSQEHMPGINGVLGITKRHGTIHNSVLMDGRDDPYFVDNFKNAVEAAAPDDTAAIHEHQIAMHVSHGRV